MRESNTEILKGLLEALYLLVTRGNIQAQKAGKRKEGTRIVKDAGAYLVIRELHLEVEDEGVREVCERLVDVLMEDEDEETVKDLGGVNGGDNGIEDDDDEEGKVVEIF